MGGRWKAPCQSSGRAEKKASEGEGWRTAFPGEGAAVVAASLAALPGGICRDGVGGRREQFCTTDLPASGGKRLGRGGGGRLLSCPLITCPPLHTRTHTHTHTQRRRRELGGRSVWRDRRAKGSVPPAEGRQGAVAVCVYVSAGGCGGGAAGGGGLPASAARRRASPVCVSGGGGVCGAAGPPSGLPGAGELPGAERRFVVPTPTAPRGVGGGARGV